MPFTASIIDRSFIDIPDKILKLSGAAYLRKLPVATMPWSRIRIGLICAVTPNGTSNIPDTSFTLGICSGQDYPGSAYNTINYIGASLIGTQTVAATRLMTYTAAGPYYACTAGAFFKKEEGTLTNATTFSTAVSLALVNTGRYRRRTLLVLDITKTEGGTGAITLTLYGPSAALAQTTDYRPDDLQWALDSIATPVIRDQALTQLDTKSTLNFSPILGDIDTFEVYWSNTDFPLEISALGAVITAIPFYASAGTGAILGTAIDTFESYTINGSVASDFLTGGSGWSAAGLIGYEGLTYNSGSNSNSSNLAAQTYTDYVGSTCWPYDTFADYSLGTVYPESTLAQGSFWATTGSVSGFTNFNPSVYTELDGTTNGFAFDTFEQYGTNDSTSGTTAIFVYGSYWESYGTIYNGSFYYAGTTISNAYPLSGSQTLAGTTYGTPYDTFESYGTGTVISGVTLNAGSYWDGYGTIFTLSYP